MDEKLEAQKVNQKSGQNFAKKDGLIVDFKEMFEPPNTEIKAYEMKLGSWDSGDGSSKPDTFGLCDDELEAISIAFADDTVKKLTKTISLDLEPSKDQVKVISRESLRNTGHSGNGKVPVEAIQKDMGLPPVEHMEYRWQIGISTVIILIGIVIFYRKLDFYVD